MRSGPDNQLSSGCGGVAGMLSVSEEELKLKGEIERLENLSRRGCWGLCAFVALSAGAVLMPSGLARLPGGIRSVLGTAPPLMLVSIALSVYVFSALVLILARMMSGSSGYRGWSHLFYLGGFYFFYSYAGAPEENFWAVFLSGFTILGLEAFNVWHCCTEEIAERKRKLARLAFRIPEKPGEEDILPE